MDALKKSALIIVDLQRDFLPGGSLGIPGADAIIPLINALMDQFGYCVATKDWHPPHHISFASTHHKKPGDRILVHGIEQVLWPDHCVAGTRGAELTEKLHQQRIDRIFHKGTDPQVDSYSVFFDQARHRSTGLADDLHARKIRDLYFVGLATDYCVLYSVLDALDLGFHATVIRDGCQAIDLKPGDEKRALHKMQTKGARVVYSGELLTTS